MVHKGNVFKLYEDIPSKYEAWDIVATYLDRILTTEPGIISEHEKGPVFMSFLVTKKIFVSALRQKIILYHDVSRMHDTEAMIQSRFQNELNMLYYTESEGAMGAPMCGPDYDQLRGLEFMYSNMESGLDISGGRRI